MRRKPLIRYNANAQRWEIWFYSLIRRDLNLWQPEVYEALSLPHAVWIARDLFCIGR
jgi:hypothetical protein